MNKAGTTEDVEYVKPAKTYNHNGEIVFAHDDAFSDNPEDSLDFSVDAFCNKLATNLKCFELRDGAEGNHVGSEPLAACVTHSESCTIVKSGLLEQRTSENITSPSIQVFPRDSVALPTTLSRTEDNVDLAGHQDREDSEAELKIQHFDTTAHVSSPTMPMNVISISNSLPSSFSTQRIQHHPAKPCGPSALEKVLSKTRPTYLPPKAKDEDRKHLADWEAMMKQSRDADERKRALKASRRLTREHAVAESSAFWESHILPDWTSALRDEEKRQTWRLGIPPKLRGLVWGKVVGNDLALSKDNYRSCTARANRALAAGTFPTTTLNLIDSDIRSTLPTLHLFMPTSGPLYHDLKSILCAWVVSRSDEGLGYVVGASKIAAMFLLNMQPSSAFVAMRNFLERHCMRSFYGGLTCKEDVEAYYRIFDTLLADCMPKVYFNFKQHQVPPSAYLSDWLVPVFLDHLPLEACARIWDVLLLEGDSFLFRVVLAILAALEPRLYFPDRAELLSLLRGENRAAIEVAKRGGEYVGACKYEIYGLDEEIIWNELQTLEEWWKEKTWARIIQRELPDL